MLIKFIHSMEREMSREITSLQETIDRLHARLQQTLRALYTLHANGNDEMAVIALSRVEILNTRIAELNALLDSFDAEDAARAARLSADEPAHDMTTVVPVLRTEDDVIIDDPDDDDVEMEYRGTLVALVIGLVILALVMLFGGRALQQYTKFKHSQEVSAVVESSSATPQGISLGVADLEPAIVTAEPVVVKTANITTVTYIVQPGDTLWSIAEHQLGHGSEWGTVYGQNASTIGDNPNLIFPGQSLTLSKVSVGSDTITGE